jgi:hypothetical protein
MKQIVVQTPLTVVGTYICIAHSLCQKAESIEGFKEDRSLSQSFCVSRYIVLTDRREVEGVSEEPSHTTAKKPGPLYNI